MSSKGRMIREKREKLKMPLRVLGDLVGLSTTTMWRIEKGERPLYEPEVEGVADALGLDPDRLRQAAGAETDAVPSTETLHSGGFFDVLNALENYIELSETLRVQGQPYLAIEYVDRALGQIRGYLEKANRSEIPLWRRLLAKALITRAIAFTMIVDTETLDHRHGFDPRLAEIGELRKYLREGDKPYRDIAIMLPGMMAYLRGEFQFADAWLEKNLQDVETPYMSGLGLRDRIVIAGHLGRRDDYHLLAARASDAFDADHLEFADRARVLEGLAQAALQLSLPDVQDSLAQAEEIYAEAELRGEGRVSVAVQIARTRIMALVHSEWLDEELILETARSGLRRIKGGRFQRHLNQIKRLLAQTDSKKINEFSASLSS